MAKIEDIKVLTKARLQNKTLGKYSNDELDDSIRNAFMEIMGTDTFKTKRDFHRAYSKHKEELYEIIEDSVDQYIKDSQDLKSEFYKQFVEFKSEAIGDVNEFYIENDQDLIVSKLANSNWTIFKQRIDNGSIMSTSIQYIGLAIEEDYMRFISGRCDYPRMVMKMAKAIDDYLTQLAYDTFSMALTHALPIFQPAGAYNEELFNRTVQAVEAANGQEAYILGTETALRKIQAETLSASSLMSNEMKNQVNSNGLLTVHNGKRCIVIPNGFKAGKLVKEVGGKKVPDFIFDDDKVYILTGDEKPIKMFMESPEMNRDWTYKDNSDMTMGEELITGIGATLAYNKAFGVYTLS